MARGDGGKVVFETDDDRLVFLKSVPVNASDANRYYFRIVAD
jgi:hypothetical protein